MTPSTTPNPYKFWETNRGTVMMGLGAVLLVGVLYVALPLIVTLVSNLFTALGFMIGAVILAVVLGFLGMIVTNKRFLTALTLYSDLVSRKVLRGVIDSDPIASAKSALARMRKRREEIRQSERAVLASLRQVEGVINENAERTQTEFSLADKAQRSRKPGQAEVHARTAAELQASNRNLEPVYKQMRLYAQIFQRVGESADIKIAFFDRKIGIKERELAVKQAGQKAADSARRMFSGTDNELLQESMDSISEQIATAEADMEQFMTEIMPTLQADDLQRGVDSERGMQSLQKWLEGQKSKSDTQSLLPSGQASSLLLQSGVQLDLPDTQREPLKVPSSFDTFFRNTNNDKQ